VNTFIVTAIVLFALQNLAAFKFAKQISALQ
jgi:hypothetical protein